MRIPMCSVKTWFQRRERVYGFSTEVRCAPHVIELDAPDCLACMEPWFQSARMVRIAGCMRQQTKAALRRVSSLRGQSGRVVNAQLGRAHRLWTGREEEVSLI